MTGPAAGQLARRAEILGRRISLIGRAKQVAVPVVSCVQARLSPGQMLGDLTADELQALVIVLADAADPAIVKAIADAAADDGRPCVEDRDLLLRTAHAQAQRYRGMGRTPPTRVAVLEREYYSRRRHAQRAAAKQASDAA